MNTATCPDRESLRRLLLGKLRVPQAEQLEEHLLHCDDCSDAAGMISASDELIAAVQAPKVVYGEESIVAQVIERGKQLRSQAETVETDESNITTSLPQAEKVANSPDIPSLDEEIDFLAPAEQPDEIGRLSDYRILEVLGVGGMGVVFRAEDPKLERQIALKAMKPAVAASRSAKDRFLREAKATAAIEHDNIVTIHHVGEDRGIPFIAMQFLRGESLQNRLEREQQLAQREVLRIGREVATGLEAAHKRKLVHRDIKPDNIWLEEQTGRVKIVDFGLVRTVTDDIGLTQSGMVLGTPRYMAPEQAEGKTVDHRCDLFSLGSVLYRLATGKAPFEGNPTATLSAVVQKDPVSVDELRLEIDSGLSQLIMRLLSKDEDLRPQSAAEVSNAIAEIEERIKQQEITETPELSQFPVPVTKPKSRKPIFFGGAVVAIALAIFFGLWAAGIIFKVETKDGTLVVKVTGNDFETSVQGQKVTIRNTETDETFTIDLNSPEETKPLRPGSYLIVETDSGLKASMASFTIRSGKSEVVEVWWEPNQQIAKEDVGEKAAAQSPPSKLLIFAPVYDREMLNRLEMAFAKEELSSSVTSIDSLADMRGDESGVLVIVMDKEAFLYVGDYNPEDLKHRKIIGIGYGAAKLFGELGLKINGGACAHGTRGPPGILLRNNTALATENLENPFYLFTPRILDPTTYHNDFIFGVYIGERARERRNEIEVLGVLTKNHNYAPITKQGTHILVGVDAPVNNWSEPLQKLLRVLVVKLGNAELSVAFKASKSNLANGLSRSLSFSALPDQLSIAAAKQLVLPASHGSSEILTDSVAIYVGYGSEHGKGRILEIDGNGKLLGSIALPGAPHSLAYVDGRIAVALSTHEPSVVVLSPTGEIEELPLEEQTFPSVTGISSTGRGAQLLVADNEVNIIAMLSSENSSQHSVITRISGDKDFRQRTSLAVTGDNHLLYSGTFLEGVYRFSLNANSDMGDPVLQSYARVAADLKSTWWVAALDEELVVFDGPQEKARLRFPASRTAWFDLLAFGPEKTVVIALHTGTAFEVYHVNLKDSKFSHLFTLDLERVKALTVAPKMNWPMK